MPDITLTLMRHAKSCWKERNQSDHDRPLNSRGNMDAPRMAQRLVDRDSVPATILSSTSQRTRETTKHVLSVFGQPEPTVIFSDSLYLGSPLALMSAVLELPDTHTHIMLVAHNPGIEDLSAHLSGAHGDVMPTSSIRQFTCASFDQLVLAAKSLDQPSSSRAQNSTMQLVFSDYPKSQP